jgi:hypothetical protein
VAREVISEPENLVHFSVAKVLVWFTWLPEKKKKKETAVACFCGLTILLQIRWSFFCFWEEA